MKSNRTIESKIIEILNGRHKSGILNKDLLRELNIDPNTTEERRFYKIKKELHKSKGLKSCKKGRNTIVYLQKNKQYLKDEWQIYIVNDNRIDSKKKKEYEKNRKNSLRKDKKFIFDRDHLNCFNLGIYTIFTGIAIHIGFQYYDDPSGEDQNYLQQFCKLINWEKNDYLIIQEVLGISKPYSFDNIPKDTPCISSIFNIFESILKYLKIQKSADYAHIYHYGFTIGLFLLDIHTREKTIYTAVIDKLIYFSRKFCINPEYTKEFLDKIKIEHVLDFPQMQAEIVIPYYIKVAESIESSIDK